MPPIRRCGTMAVHHRLLEQDPAFRKHQADLEELTLRRRAAGVSALRTTVARIPTVVHVLHRTQAEKVTKTQVQSQIDVLNQDFRATNKDTSAVPEVWRGLVTDARVEFVLATQDAKGAKTDGIVDVPTNVAEFADDDGMKSSRTGGSDPWPPDRFFNVWVCALGGGLLGYAQFPGGPRKTDGVVIAHHAFGTRGTARAPFDLGRTATHEVGHWLNLRHIWGDTEDCTGSDFVPDTPNAALPNYGTPSFPHVSCQNGPHGDMFMNYMDYVDDAAMVMFTAQQVVRMHAALDGPRKSLLGEKPKPRVVRL